jgi:hypothetical protein
MATLSAVNRALNSIPKRAESRASTELRDTFVDSGISGTLESVDHQVLYGRRGTGKTHAFSYLASKKQEEGDIGVYVDLRTIGSAEGLFDDGTANLVDRTGNLLVDLLVQVHDAILQAVLDDEELFADSTFVNRLDGMASAITAIRVAGDVEQTVEGEFSETNSSGVTVGATAGGGISAALNAESSSDTRGKASETRRGREQARLNFSDIARALRQLASSLSARRIWLMLDEWSSLPLDVQPYLGAFLVRCVLPVQAFTVKIAAIEQQTNFRQMMPNGQMIGIELGADISANVSLDDFMVFEQDQERARAFFRGLLFKHLTAGIDSDRRVGELRRESDLISLGFTGSRVFDELVRAAEGVSRDAINIAGKAAWRAGAERISMPDVRAAAQQWYQEDKEGAVRSIPEAHALLNWVIDKVIREKRARGFLINQRHTNSPLLVALFEARVLHLVRRGYSAQDEPGERYDVYVIDYGAYVDLINTARSVVAEDDFTDKIDVPTQDLRALRRAILDLDEFDAQSALR